MININRKTYENKKEEILLGLDKEQLAAVTCDINSNILCNAIAGSGKTHVLTRRVAWLIANGIRPENILLLTFTVKASKEMIGRVNDSLGMDSRNSPIKAGTFHSVASRHLRKYSEAIGHSKRFTILDNDDSKSIVSDIRKKYLNGMEVENKDEFPKSNTIFGLYSKSINLNKKIEDFNLVQSEHIWHVKRIISEYVSIKEKTNSMDFDDLVVNFVRILRIDRIREEIKGEISHVLVDEYQDVNHLQEEIVRLISGKENIFVVGDPAQSIYKFRGSNILYIRTFCKQFNAKEVNLKTNYRSDKNVLKLAENAINKNQQTRYVEINPFKETNFEQSLDEYSTYFEEIDNIISKIKSLLNQGVDPNEIAILIRSSNKYSATLEINLRRNNIDYDLRAGFSYFHRKHIKDLIAMATLLVNNRCLASFKRVLSLHKGVGVKTLEKIREFFIEMDYDFKVSLENINNLKCSKNAKESVLALFSALDAAAEEVIVAEQLKLLCNYYTPIFESRSKSEEELEERLEEIMTFPYLIETPSLDDFLEEIVLDSEKDKDNDVTNKIIISTMHRSKGLEFENVFLPFMNLGYFPKKMDVPLEDIEEERRLFYVALTRAKKQLFISHFSYADGNYYEQSPFLDDMLLASYPEESTM